MVCTRKCCCVWLCRLSLQVTGIFFAASHFKGLVAPRTPHSCGKTFSARVSLQLHSLGSAHHNATLSAGSRKYENSSRTLAKVEAAVLFKVVP